jgi:hypothetical protein
MRPSNAAILALLDTGMTQGAVADRLGITKNTVAGIRSRAGLCVPAGPPASTMAQRLDALHARMDAILAETRGVGSAGRILPAGMPNTPKMQGTQAPNYRVRKTNPSGSTR